MADLSPIATLKLQGNDQLIADGVAYACTIGRAGVAEPGQKREGDLMTPSGSFSLRRCYYRPDRIAELPESELPCEPLNENDGWCDDEKDPQYNKHVTLPYAARHEKLWREDHVYDLIIPLGYNDDLVVPGLGSAIFLHLMRDDGVGTEGCIAVSKETLLALLPQLTTETVLVTR